MDFDPETAPASDEISSEPSADAGQAIEESRERPPARIWRERGEPLAPAVYDSEEERAKPEWNTLVPIEGVAQPRQAPADPDFELYPEPSWREILFTLFSANCKPWLQAAALFALGVVTALLGMRLAHRISPLPSGLGPAGVQVQREGPSARPRIRPAARPSRKQRATRTPLAREMTAGLTSAADAEGKTAPGKLSLASSRERVSPVPGRSRHAAEADIVAPDTVVRYAPRPAAPDGK